MNSLIIVLCILTTAFSCTPADIKTFVLQQPLTQNCEVAISGDRIVVACITKPIFKRSDRIAYENMLETKLKEKFALTEVYISYDLKVYYDLSKLEKKSIKDQNIYIENIIQIIKIRKNETA